MKKKFCEQCGYYALNFSESNNQIILDEQAKYIKQGKRRSVEQIVNKIISEYKPNN